jgi:ABC-type transporter Mla subunit MlaD
MEGRSRPQSHRTAGRDEPITAVLLEIAALSRRIGRRAADLARLAEATRQPAADGDTAAARDLAAAAAEVAAGAAAVTTLSRTAHHAHTERHLSPVAAGEAAQPPEPRCGRPQPPRHGGCRSPADRSW